MLTLSPAPVHEGPRPIAVFSQNDRSELPHLRFLLGQVHRGIYVLGLVVAALALTSVVIGRLGWIIRRSRILGALVGVIALFELASLGVTGIDGSNNIL
jgi:hypothetical protein